AIRWRYEHELTTKEFCCGPANRGVAVTDDRVYMATLDGQLVALDTATGELAWRAPIVDAEARNEQAQAREALTPLIGDSTFSGATVTGGTGYSANMAPQVVGDTVLVGITGAGYGLHLDLEREAGEALSVVGLAGGLNGLRGFLVAYDAQTGEERWRWYSVQGPDWAGDYAEQTAYGVDLADRDGADERARADEFAESWRLGGGSIWTTPAVDLELGLLYIGTGNPAPQMAGESRPGDNRDTVSLVALDLKTGREAWAYQQVPHDVWGYDVASPPVLASVFIDGAVREVVAQASKTGWVFMHDRRTGELLQRSEPFVPQRNLFRAPSAEGVEVAPAILGGASWSPMAYSPVSSSFFVAAIHQPATYYVRSLDDSDGPWRSYAYMELSGEERWGLLSALDARTGRLRWQQRTAEPLVGGVLATAGGLLFCGEGDGHFNAYDADSGDRLWRWQAPYGVNAPPVTYSVAGRQYVTVAAGGNALFGFATGDAILTFALPQSDRIR
ncbi:MAG: PQQ-binding-like beta-propeller repeat protein, partial [Pseudomonadota bacterium]